MNKLIALTTLIVSLNVVSSRQSPLCRLIGGDAEKTAIFWGCMNENFPAVAINLINRCYQTSFASAEPTGNFLEALCEENDDDIRAMTNCMEEGRAGVLGMEYQVMRTASENSETCFMEKTGLTREEYGRILSNRHGNEED